MIFGNYTLSFGADDIRSGGSMLREKVSTRIYPVSSWQGKIEEIMFPFPDFEVCDDSYDKILISFLEALPQCNVTLLTPFLIEKEYPGNQAFSILKGLIEKYSNENRRIDVIYVPDVKLWNRDRLFVFESHIGHKSYLLEPIVPQKPKSGLAGFIDAARPNSFEKLKFPSSIEGGDFLYGDDFILTTSKRRLDFFQPFESAYEDNCLVDQNGYETIDFCIPDKYEHIQIFPDRGSEYENAMKFSNGNFKISFQDPLYHLDLFANLIGYGETEDEFRILIGALENSSGITDLSPLEKVWFEGNNRALDLISKKLQGLILKSGKKLKVIRTPIPVVCEENKEERKWIPLPLNNGLVESYNQKTLLYIPTFSPVSDASGSRQIFHKDLNQAEEKFSTILKTHKILVKKLANHWKMIEKGGALHCLSLEVRRTKN
ncbi:MAG: hypothetical protein R2769_17455 [Saprospiraceae bacterium]